MLPLKCCIRDTASGSIIPQFNTRITWEHRLLMANCWKLQEIYNDIGKELHFFPTEIQSLIHKCYVTWRIL